MAAGEKFKKLLNYPKTEDIVKLVKHRTSEIIVILLNTLVLPYSNGSKNAEVLAYSLHPHQTGAQSELCLHSFLRYFGLLWYDLNGFYQVFLNGMLC